MTQLKRSNVDPFTNCDYHEFDINQMLENQAKQRSSYNIDFQPVDDSEIMLFGTDLDDAIDEMTSTWGAY